MLTRKQYIPKIPKPSKAAVKAQMNFWNLGNQDISEECPICKIALSVLSTVDICLVGGCPYDFKNPEPTGNTGLLRPQAPPLQTK